MVEYLKTPPTRERLKELIAAIVIPVCAILRENGTPYAELGLGDPKWSEDELLDSMMAHPILINLPIVVTPKGAKLCRRFEAVLGHLAEPGYRPICQRRRRGRAAAISRLSLEATKVSAEHRSWRACDASRLRQLSEGFRAFRANREGPHWVDSTYSHRRR